MINAVYAVSRLWLITRALTQTYPAYPIVQTTWKKP